MMQLVRNFRIKLNINWAKSLRWMGWCGFFSLCALIKSRYWLWAFASSSTIKDSKWEYELILLNCQKLVSILLPREHVALSLAIALVIRLMYFPYTIPMIHRCLAYVHAIVYNKHLFLKWHPSLHILAPSCDEWNRIFSHHSFSFVLQRVFLSFWFFMKFSHKMNFSHLQWHLQNIMEQIYFLCKSFCWCLWNIFSLVSVFIFFNTTAKNISRHIAMYFSVCAGIVHNITMIITVTIIIPLIIIII